MGPLASLAVTFLLGALAVGLFWPGRGLWWRLRRALSADRKVQLEDALKHLYDCEYRGSAATVHSLAGALGLAADRAAELLERLQELGLVATSSAGHRLTAEGRSGALRIIRTHRLWERFLSDETSLGAEDWHREAEIREHRTSALETERLSARLGHPRYDPHGDPIPTPSGEMPPAAGTPLTELPEGGVAEIVHVEDEPEAIYAQLAANGLHPGITVRVLRVGRRHLDLEVHGEELTLAPVVAANLHVRPIARGEAPEASEALAALEPGQAGRVVAISPLLRGSERRRLLDLGVVPGTVVTADRRAPGGDPTAYRVRGTVIALRREQAALVQVRRDGGAEEAPPAERRGDAA